jgi:hypothetical protein
MLKSLLKNKMVWAGIILCVVIQLVFLFIIVPAVDHIDDDNNISNIKVAIVNDDAQKNTNDDKSTEIISNLKDNLPFTAQEETKLSTAFDKMNANYYNAVFYFGKNFSNDLLKTDARIVFYVNQATSSMAKQAMDKAVTEINLNMNENAFDTVKSNIIDAIDANFTTIKFPQSAVDSIVDNLGTALGIMKDGIITGMTEQLENFKLPDEAKSSLVDNVDKALGIMRAKIVDNFTGQLKAFKLPDSVVTTMKTNLDGGLSNLKTNALGMISGQLKAAGLSDSAIAAVNAKIGAGFDAMKANVINGIAANIANFKLPDEAIAAVKENLGKGFNTIRSKVISGFGGNLANIKLPGSAITTVANNLSDGFDTLRQKALQAVQDQFASFQLPDSLMNAIKGNLNTAFEALNYTTIECDVENVNDSDAYILTIAPFFLFIVFFLASALYTAVHYFAFKPMTMQYNPMGVFLYRCTIDIIASIIIPVAFFIVLWSFNIRINTAAVNLWTVLSVGFFCFVQLLQVCADLLTIKGFGLCMMLLMPLQMVTNGVMFPTAVLPPFFSTISSYLPATHFGSGVIKAFFGGSSTAGDITSLLVMAGVCMAVSAVYHTITVMKHRKNKDGEVSAI